MENRGKKRIIQAAMEVMKEHSPEKTTMRKVAEKAGVTTGAIYHHYKGKEELLFDVMKESLQFTHQMTKAQASSEYAKSSELLLEEIVQRVSKRLSMSDEQKIHMLMVTDAVSGVGIIAEKYRQNYKESIKNTGDLFEKAFDIKNEEYKYMIASVLISAIDGMALQQSLGVFPEKEKKMIETFHQFFVESIPNFLRKKHN